MEKTKTKEIDIIGLFCLIIKEWRKLGIATVIGAVVGVIIALCTPKVYTASVTLIPEISSSGMSLNSNLADIASQFGVDLDNKNGIDAIYPELYPDIFATTDFTMAMFDVPVRTKDDNATKPYLQHVLKDSKHPFWEYPGIYLRKILEKKPAPTKNDAKDSYKLSKKDFELCKMTQSNVNCVVDKKTSIITISVKDQDPLVAAIMADTLRYRLQEYITAYKTKKARIDYNYYKRLAEETKRDYQVARDKYTAFCDGNTDIQLPSYQQMQTELEDNMQRLYDNYKMILVSKRQAHAKIQENTPAFVLLERAVTPNKPSSTPRVFIVLSYIILSWVITGAWILYKKTSTHRKIIL